MSIRGRLLGMGEANASGLRLARLASLGWTRFLDLLYPPRCGGCDTRGTLLCDDCYSSISPPLLETQLEGIDAFSSAGTYKEPLRQAIYKLKY